MKTETEQPKTGWVIDKDLKIWQVVQDENLSFYRLYDALNRFKGMMTIDEVAAIEIIHPSFTAACKERYELMKAELNNYLEKQKQKP